MGKGGMMDEMMKPGGMMDEMMRKMGAPKPKQLYPKMMDFPDLPEEDRHQFGREAGKRMKEGLAVLSNGVDQLLKATNSENYQAMQNSTAVIREGLGIFESGLSAQRAIAQGHSPRMVALKWFKKELNIISPPKEEQTDNLFGLSILHLVTMLFLLVFFVGVVVLYFSRMRRANELIAKLSDIPTIPNSQSNSIVKKANKFFGDLILSKIITETPQAKTFRFAAASGGQLPFSYDSGQFLTLELAPEGKKVRRSYSISSSPTKREYCDITVKKEDLGLVSKYLCDSAKEGSIFSVKAPAGKLTFDEKGKKGVVLISGGVGVTPVMSILRYLTEKHWPGQIYFFYSCKSFDLVIFRDELLDLSRRFENVHIYITLTADEQERPDFFKGRLNKDIFTAQVPNIRELEVILCGSQRMMDGVISNLTEIGLPRSQIKTESFGKSKKAIKSTPDTSSQTHSIKFVGDDRELFQKEEQTVLDVADENDIEIDNSCRDGSCGTCIVKLVSGEVDMECEDGLDDSEKKQGMVLACQAKAKTDLVIEV